MIKFSQINKYLKYNILNLIGFSINFALLYYLNMFLEDEAFGIFFLTYTIMNTVSFSFQPIAYYIIKEISLKNENNKKKFIVLVTNLFFKINLIITFILILFIFLINQIGIINSYYLYISLILSISGYAFYDLMRAVLEGLNKITVSVYFFILNNIIKFSLIIIATILFNSVYPIFYSIFFTFILITIFQGVILRRFIEFNFLKKFKHSFIDLKRLSLAFIFYFFMLLIINFDLIICYFIFDKQTLAIYASSSIIAKSINTIFNPIYRIFIPLLSSGYDENSIFENKKNKDSIILFSFLVLLILIVFTLSKDFYLNSNFVFQNLDRNIFLFSTYSIFPILIYRFILLKGYSSDNFKSIFYALLPMMFFLFFVVYMKPDILSFAKYFFGFSFILPIYFWLFSSKKRFYFKR